MRCRAVLWGGAFLLYWKRVGIYTEKQVKVKKSISGTGGRGDLFQKAATQILHRMWDAPKPEIGGTVQAEKTSVAVAIFFWGCLVTY